jgi:hypothetical protein
MKMDADSIEQMIEATERYNQMKKKVKPEVTEVDTEQQSVPVAAKGKLFAEEAHAFLKVLGKWVELKKTFPSGYVDYHEATRKFLEEFHKANNGD